MRIRPSGTRVSRWLLGTRNGWLTLVMLSAPALAQRTAWVDNGGPPILQIHVSYYNYAGVPQSVMTEGLTTSERIFSQAAIQVMWSEALRDSKTLQPTSNDDRVLWFYLRILPRSMTNRLERRFEVIGSAFTSDDNSSEIANVFYDRLEGLPASVTCSRATMLGHVIAHELGHLLLGNHSHSRLGIMSPNWQKREQIVQLRAGALLFLPEEAERIRHNILEREHRLRIISTVP